MEALRKRPRQRMEASNRLQRLVESLDAPFMTLELSAFSQPVSVRLARFVGYVDPEPPDPVRRLSIEYCVTDNGRPVVLLDQELTLPAPEEGWAVTVGAGGLFGDDAEWELWDDAGAHVKTFARDELPVAFRSETGQLRLALAVDPEVAESLEVDAVEPRLRPLQPEDRQLLRP